MNSKPVVTAEADLLFHCAAGRPDSTAIRNLVEEGVDWPAFLALAEEHHLTPLCCRRLESACPESIPPEFLESLRRQFRKNVERNLFLTGELFRILQRLEENGVRALAFKGPVLAWWLYDHPGLRQFQDLDILVAEGDLDRVGDLLGEIEYRAETGQNGQVKRVPSVGQMSLLRAVPLVVVDLHWELAPCSMGLSLNARRLMPRAQAVGISGLSVSTLGAEDQVLFCALHGGKHGWVNLAWLADLSALIENRPPDWARLLADARRMRLSRALFVGLRLARNLLGTQLPAAVQKAIERDKASAAMAQEASDSLLKREARPRLFERTLRFELQLTEGWTRQLRFLWNRIAEPSTEDWESRKSARPFRLLKKYVVRWFAGPEASVSAAR